MVNSFVVSCQLILIDFCNKFTSKFLLFRYMRRHESLISGNNSDSFSSSNQSNFFVAYIPWSRWFRKEFYIRNIIHRIDHFFERYIDISLFSFFFDLKIFDKLILFEKFQNLNLEIWKGYSFYGSFSRHICVFYSNKQIMNRSVNIRHLRV